MVFADSLSYIFVQEADKHPTLLKEISQPTRLAAEKPV
jgi:hypothetical protein